MIETILKYTGFFTKKRALSEGFNKYGSYYGIPIWIKTDDFTVVEKHIVFFIPMMFFTFLELLINIFKDEDFDDIGFLFKIKGDIDK